MKEASKTKQKSKARSPSKGATGNFWEKRKTILDMCKNVVKECTEKDLLNFGTQLKGSERVPISGLFEIQKPQLKPILDYLSKKVFKVGINELQEIVKIIHSISEDQVKKMMKAIEGFPMQLPEILSELLKLKKSERIHSVTESINKQFHVQDLKKWQRLVWNFIKPQVCESLNGVQKKLQSLKSMIGEKGLGKLLSKIFYLPNKSLSDLMTKNEIKSDILNKYLLSLQNETTKSVLVLRIKIIFEGIDHKEKKKKIQRGWEAKNFDQIKLLMSQKFYEDERLDLRPIQKINLIELPTDLKVQFLESRFYEQIPSYGKDNNCFINTLYGLWHKQHHALTTLNNSSEFNRCKLKELLRRWAIEISTLTESQLKILAEDYWKFNKFLQNMHPHGKIEETNPYSRGKIIQQILQLALNNLKEKVQIDFALIYWIVKKEAVNVKIYIILGDKIISYEFNNQKWKGQTYCFKLSSGADGMFGHYTRLIEIDVEDQRVKKKIEEELRQNRLIINKFELEQFFKTLSKNFQMSKNFGKAYIQTKLQWENRKRYVNFKKQSKEQYCLSKRFGEVVIKLSEEQLQAIDVLDVQKTKSVVIVRESGKKDTDLGKIVKWNLEGKKQTQLVQRIWMSSEGFDQIIWGMKIPDSDGNLKMAPSAFLRAYEKIRQSKKNGIIVFENLQVLNQAQRDQLAEVLIDFLDGFLEINGKKLKVSGYLMVILRARDINMLESWKYVSQATLKTLKPLQNQDEQKNQMEEILQENIKFERNQNQFMLNLGRYGSGMRIPLKMKIENSFQEQTEKWLYKEGFIATPQSIEILAKCHETVVKNKVFLILEGPTGVGKTHIPTIYAILTKKQFKQEKLSDKKLGNISFHRGKGQSELQGNFIIKDDKIEWDGLTTFAKVVQNGGVIMLSQLNTVIKNHQASLAWWLKQVEQSIPDQNGDRVITLQSIVTHGKQCHSMKIKKGTLIVIDINTKDYQGRTPLPDHFVPDNRIQVKPLITDTSDQNLINQEMKVLRKYIEMYWDQSDGPFQKRENNQSEVGKELQQLNKMKQQKYELFARLFRNLVLAYQNQQFGKLTKQDIQKGQTKQWIFSIREMQRIIEDIRQIPEKELNKNQKFHKILYEHLALRWRQKGDRQIISQILADSLKIEKPQIKLNARQFMLRNLVKQKRAVLWMMDECQINARQQILNLDLQIKPQNIQTYKISNQVGEWQLLGGQVPNPKSPSQISFQLGVLGKWLETHKSSKQKHLLILENIDKIDGGTVTVLNNFLQDLKKGTISINGQQYSMPENGMILLVAREQICWSPAQSSRPVFFRMTDMNKNETKVLNQIESTFRDFTPRFKQFGIDIVKIIRKFLTSKFKEQNEQKKDTNELCDDIKLTQMLNKFKQKLSSELKDLEQKLSENKENQKKLDEFQQNSNQQKIKRLKNQLQSLKQEKKCLTSEKKAEEDNIEKLNEELLENNQDNVQKQLEKHEAEKKKIEVKIQQIQKKIKIISKEIGKINNQTTNPTQINRINQKLQQNNEFIKNKADGMQDYVNQLGFSFLDLIAEIQDMMDLFNHKRQNNKTILLFNKKQYKTRFDRIPKPQQFSKMKITLEVAETLQLVLLAIKKNKTVYLQGKPGVGKTKMTQFLAQLLNLPIFIFQMSANIELNDLLGGLDLAYENQKKIIVVNRKKQLIKMIKEGGIFVLDEAAMSTQAKEVISWFSQIAQKRPGEKITLHDIPGHPLELTIHPQFHLIITGNDPKITLGRKELPNEVLYFVDKIIYPETQKKEHIIEIANSMIKNITETENKNLAKQIGEFHFTLNQEFKQKISITKRDMQKVISILKQKIKTKQVTPNQVNRALYQVYFAKLSETQNIPFRLKQKFSKYFDSVKDLKFDDHLQIMSQKQPLLILYETKMKSDLIKQIHKKYPELQVLKAMSSFTEQNLLGGFAPDHSGRMVFQLTGIGSYLIQQAEINKHKQMGEKIVLIDGIHTIKEGVRTQLNQFLQDGWTYIQNKKYYWPENLRLLFPIPVQKMDQLSEPYVSRHQQLRYKLQKYQTGAISETIQAKNIENILEKREGIRLLNFFGNQPQKYEALKKYRQNHQANYIRLSVSENSQEFDWIAEVNRQQKKFSLNKKGLFLGLQQGDKTIEIVGIERNPEMLGVIESIVLLNWVGKTKLKTMVPGLEPMDLKEITIIFETQDKLNEAFSGVMEWKQLKYYNVEKNKKLFQIKKQPRITKITSVSDTEQKDSDQQFSRQIQKSIQNRNARIKTQTSKIDLSGIWLQSQFNQQTKIIKIQNEPNQNDQMPKILIQDNSGKGQKIIIQKKVEQKEGKKSEQKQQEKPQKAQDKKQKIIAKQQNTVQRVVKNQKAGSNQINKEKKQQQNKNQDVKKEKKQQKQKENQNKVAKTSQKVLKICQKENPQQRECATKSLTLLLKQNEAKLLKPQLKQLLILEKKTSRTRIHQGLKYYDEDLVENQANSQSKKKIGANNGQKPIQNDKDKSIDQQSSLKQQEKKKINCKIQWQTQQKLFLSQNEEEGRNLFQVIFNLDKNKTQIMSPQQIQNIYYEQNMVNQFSEMLKLLPNLPHLKFLSLNFCKFQLNQEIQKEISELGKRLKDLKNIEILELNFEQFFICKQLQRRQKLIHFLESLEFLEKLKVLNLNFRRCQIHNVLINQLGKRIGKLKNIQDLSLNFRACTQITDQSLKYLSSQIKFKNLKRLTLILGKCQKVTQIFLDSFSEDIRNLYNLEYLYLDFSYCSQIKSIENLNSSIKSLKRIKSLSLNFIRCQNLSGDSTNILRFYSKNYRNQIQNLSYIIDLPQITLSYEQLKELVRMNQQQGIKLLLFLIRQQLSQDYGQNQDGDTSLNQVLQFYMSNEQIAQQDLSLIYKKIAFANKVLCSVHENYFVFHNNQYFQVKDLIEYNTSIQLHFPAGYLELIQRLTNKRLMNIMQVQKLLRNLVKKKNQQLGYFSNQKWKMNEIIEFIKTIDPAFKLKENVFWGLKDMIETLLQLVFANTAFLKNQREQLFGIFTQVFTPMLKVMFENIVNNSILSKNHWLRFVTGQRREVAYGKSGGTFMVKRYLQGKMNFYRRSCLSEGDQKLDRKLQGDYDILLKAETDIKIKMALERNPKLIYAFKPEALQIMLKNKNNLALAAFNSSTDLLRKLPNNLQNLYKTCIEKK